MNNTLILYENDSVEINNVLNKINEVISNS